MIKWMKDGKMLWLNIEKYVGGGLDDIYFIVIFLIKEDRGIYLCIIMNVVGFVLKVVELGIIYNIKYICVCNIFF